MKTKPCSQPAHHWVIDTGVGNLHRGVCKHCKQVRSFIPDTIVSKTGRQQISIRPRKLLAPTATINPAYWSWKPTEKIRWII